MTARTTFYFDGGARPNPGPMEVAVVSRGRTWFRDDLGIGDNNEAEWTALLHAVDLAIACRATDVLFVGDSAIVVEQARGRQPCRSAQLQPYLLTFRREIAAIPRFGLKHVPRAKNLAGIALARRNLP
jgi:ribonuclease HI